MNVAILAETIALDIAAYKCITASILNNDFPNLPYTFPDLPISIGNKGNLLKLLPITIDVIAQRITDLDLVLIFVDCDTKSYQDQCREVKEKFKLVKTFPTNRIVIGAAQRTIEAWMLTDPQAVKKVSGLVSLGKILTIAEKIIDPRSELRRLWRNPQCKTTYPTFVVDIARNLDVQKINDHSKSFSAFYSDLHAAVHLMNAK